MPAICLESNISLLIITPYGFQRLFYLLWCCAPNTGGLKQETAGLDLKQVELKENKDQPSMMVLLSTRLLGGLGTADPIKPS